MDHREQIIEFMNAHFNEKVELEDISFIRQLLEYMEYIYDESVESDELTSESSEEEEDDADKEKTSYTVDKDGFHKLD
tara:strand:- start:647 stop:880 length:234 start_codon:yes stop_codon:yes gene_type:complete